MNISNFRNTLIVNHTGDNFRKIGLPRLLRSEILIVTNKMMINVHYKNFNATTIHRLDKIDDKKIKVILIDCRIPRETSKAFKNLKKLCIGKQICFIQGPHDLRALADSTELMSVTKNPNTKTYVFNSFDVSRGYQ